MSAAEREAWAVEHAARLATWEPLIAALRSRRIDAGTENVGSGYCLAIPLSEDGARYVWLGSDDDGAEPLWMDAGLGAYVSGCAYAPGDDGAAGERYLCLDTLTIDPADPETAADLIAAMLRHVVTIPLAAYEYV